MNNIIKTARRLLLLPMVGSLFFVSSNSLAQTATPLAPLSGVTEVKIGEDGKATTTATATANPPAASPAEASAAVSPSTPAPVKSQKIPNSVAVAEFYIRKDYRDFFYDEKLNAKASVDGNANVSPVKPEEGADPKAPVAYTGSSTINAQSEVNYSKTFGTKRIISFREVRGLNAAIKSFLIKAGYQVIQPAPYTHNGTQDLDVFNIRDRAARGDFHEAEYVLQGAVVSVNSRRTQEYIQGTSDYAYKQENSIIVEFNLIHTETLQVMAAFNVSGFGADLYLGKAGARFVPRGEKISRELLASFGEDAQAKLQDNLPPIAKESGILSSVSPSSKPETGVGDASTLKVYAPAKASESTNQVEKKDPITVYKK